MKNFSKMYFKKVIYNLLKEEKEPVPDDAPGSEQLHIFDFDDTLGETLNSNAVMLYIDGEPAHKSESEVLDWLGTLGIGENSLLEPGIIPIEEKGGAYAAYLNSKALAKLQSQVPKDAQFATGSGKVPTGASKEEVLVDYTPSAGTDPDTTKPIDSTIQKLKDANSKGAKTAIVTARSAEGEVTDIHGNKLSATNAKDMQNWLEKLGAAPNAGVFGVSGGDKGDKIKKHFIKGDNPPEEVHFYDDLSKNTKDVESHMAGKIPSELFIYGPGEFAHGEADPNSPNASYAPSSQKSQGGQKGSQQSNKKTESFRRFKTQDQLIMERWCKLAGVIK
jgi:hypothetical protein